MRLHEIENQFDSVWHDHILTECSDIVKLYKSNPDKVFYRGLKGDLPYIFKDQSRSNRTPRDSVVWISQLYDMSLAKLGVNALRSNSIFVTSDPDSAIAYGRVYVIFPVNGFDYSYTNWRDIVLTPYLASKILDEDMWEAIISHPNFDKQYFWQQSLTLKGLEDYLNKLFDHKIRVDVDELVDLDRFQSTFKIYDTNLQTPLQEGKEVCIKGQYYAISADEYEKRIQQYLSLL